jgi:hypothetical protein
MQRYPPAPLEEQSIALERNDDQPTKNVLDDEEFAGGSRSLPNGKNGKDDGVAGIAHHAHRTPTRVEPPRSAFVHQPLENLELTSPSFVRLKDQPPHDVFHRIKHVRHVQLENTMFTIYPTKTEASPIRAPLVFLPS